MRRISSILAGLLVLAALAAFWMTRGSHETCPTTLQVDGRSYKAVSTPDEITEGPVIGDGTEHGCGNAGRWRQVVSLAEVPGVDPHIALSTPTAANILYVAAELSQEDLPSRVTDLIDPP